jgi:rubrerythrin
MSALLSDSHIVEMALGIEQSGAAFYEVLAKTVKYPGAKKIFKDLAKEERQHIVDFRTILTEVVERGAGDQQRLSYLKSLAEKVLFPRQKLSELTERMTNDLDALHAAIGFEEDSIRFFREIRSLVWEANYPVIDEIISQEEEHIRRLYETRNLSSSTFYRSSGIVSDDLLGTACDDAN